VAKRDQILVGLDIGTTKICAIVSEITEEGVLNIIGVGSSPSRGLRKGVVVDIESTVESIKKAVEEAELMAAVQINSVYTGIAGSHISAENCKGVVALKKAEVTRDDVQRAIESARTLAVIPHERRILHVLPREFMVDGQEGVREPLGLSGNRLEVNVHVITGAVTSAQNIIKSVNRAGLDVVDIILQPLASSEAVLSQEERDLGVAMVDLGGGTTDLAIFLDGSIRHSAVLPIGGQNLTKDLAIGLLTSPERNSCMAMSGSKCLRSGTDRLAPSRAATSLRFSNRASKKCSSWSAVKSRAQGTKACWVPASS
jgi:cell division protein FtsA